MALRWLTAGESHGPALVGILAGLPAGLDVSVDRINEELERRQQGIGRSSRQAIEKDQATILAGIRRGRTIGSPVAVLIENKDFENWREIMSPAGEMSSAANGGVHAPRPGHADLAGALKWELDDARDVLERASGRSTAMTVALGAVCKQYLERFGTFIGSRLISFGPVQLINETEPPPTRRDIGDNPAVVLILGDVSGDQLAEMQEAVGRAQEEGDTLGGSIQVIAAHVPPGLGSCATPEDRFDSRVAASALGVPGIKAVEIGAGIKQSSHGGREAHDGFSQGDGAWYARRTNFAGGIEGGMTNGEPVCLTAWMKPLATVDPPPASVDLRTGKALTPESTERSDVAAVESAACVLESALALELARAHLEKFGGDTILAVEDAFNRYLDTLER